MTMTPNLTTRQKIALAHAVQRTVMFGRRLFGRDARTLVTRRGLHWDLDLREGIDFSIWLLGTFEPSTVSQYSRILKEGDTVLDIGANIGAHTLHLARCVGAGGRVVAIEPTDFAYGKLTRNLALNGALQTRVLTVQAMLAAADTEKVAQPTYSSWPLEAADDGHPLHLGRLMSCDGARIRSLDALVEECGLARVDLMKIDIDGFECEMLRGARRTLERWRPVLVMEFAPYVLLERGASLAEMLALLAGVGYALEDVDTGESLPFDAARLDAMIPRGGCRNVLVRPT